MDPQRPATEDLHHGELEEHERPPPTMRAEDSELLKLEIHNLLTSRDLAIQLDIRNLVGHLHQLEAALGMDHGKHQHMHALFSTAERLKQSIASRDSENSSLLQGLMRSVTEHQSRLEKKLMGDIGVLQAEKQKVHGELIAQSSISSELREKVAGLRMENATLHEDLSSRIELTLKLQQEMEDLTEEVNRLLQALAEMASEMTPLKDDLYFFKEVMAPSLEERTLELERENTELTSTNQAHMSEVDSLREQAKGMKTEVFLLHEEIAMLKVQLVISYGMLKHGEGVVSMVKDDNLKLLEDMASKENRLQMLAQSLERATHDSERLRRKLSSATEERNGLQSECESLLVVLDGVKQLQQELTKARGRGASLSEANEWGAVHIEPSSNGSRGGSPSPSPNAADNNMGDQANGPSAHISLFRSLRDEVLFLQQNNNTQRTLAATKKRTEETIVKLKEAEERNRRLHTQNGSASAELDELHTTIASLQKEGTLLIGMLRTKMDDAIGEVKLVIQGCKEYVGDDEGTTAALKKLELHLHETIAFSEEGNEEGSVTKSINLYASPNADDEESRNKAISAKKKLILLTELQARAAEANMLLEAMEALRKLLFRSWSGGYTSRPGKLHIGPETHEVTEVKEQTIPVLHEEESEQMVEHQMKLGERLNQASIDEELEHELLKLKGDRKQLKEELEGRMDDVLRIGNELEELQEMLQAHGGDIRVEHRRQEEKKAALERAKEFWQIVSQRRRQLGRMKEEMMSGEGQHEAVTKKLVKALVSTDMEGGNGEHVNLTDMEGGDGEHINLLRREMKSWKALNRRHALELQTVRQDLQSMASIIESTRYRLLSGSSQDTQEGGISISDLRTQGGDIVDHRTQDSRTFVDGTEELLSPSPKERVPISGPFPLKPRHFEWFLLLFSPDRKGSGSLGAKSTSNNKRWAPTMLRKPTSGSGSTALVTSRRKIAGCLACVSTARLDSFDHR